ncbi:MAG: AmiS/UreI family transporter [Castellaniella sp.]
MLQFYLVFVGITLFVNGLHICSGCQVDVAKRSGAKDVAVVNLFTGLTGIILITLMAARTARTGESLAPAAYMGLFVLTYVWLGINAFTGADGKAFGWFSLLVPFVGIPVALQTFAAATSVFDYWMGMSWLAWSLLWFMFFLWLSRGVAIARPTGVMTAAQGVLTALLPAVLNFWRII